ncbi:2-alkenal reductase [Francisella orientalis str. Toba 04]|nr:2-alkenal reductase [Francisella orientalis str. Toba 04]
MAQGKILPYLDVPLQHSSPEVLKRNLKVGKFATVEITESTEYDLIDD